MRHAFLKSIILFLASVALTLGPAAVRAASFSVSAASREIAVGQPFEVSVWLDTEGESVNAIEGALAFPHELLELSGLRDGGSVLNFWMERPAAPEPGRVAFAGITPGGYEGGRGFVFAAIFTPKGAGAGAIGFEGLQALLNDGAGTSAALAVSGLTFMVSDQPPPVPIAPTEPDRTPPEAFTPIIASDPAFENGEWFIAFAAQDKESGVDRYEVSESGTGSDANWVPAESPYVLKDQALQGSVAVKSVDKAGNERISAAASPPAAEPFSLPYLALGIVAVLYLFVALLWRRRHRR